ncbi:hypothetical protein PABG_06593 [Paracoccidioides brasiliensis Pb03]|nr:hypothetical protein PABG_06593 [Paracoccidioides brasiliensis Pb03]
MPSAQQNGLKTSLWAPDDGFSNGAGANKVRERETPAAHSPAEGIVISTSSPWLIISKVIAELTILFLFTTSLPISRSTLTNLPPSRECRFVPVVGARRQSPAIVPETLCYCSGFTQREYPPSPPLILVMTLAAL